MTLAGFSSHQPRGQRAERIGAEEDLGGRHQAAGSAPGFSLLSLAKYLYVTMRCGLLIFKITTPFLKPPLLIIS